MNFRKRARYCQWRTTSQNKNKIDKNNRFPVYIGGEGQSFLANGEQQVKIKIKQIKITEFRYI
jgi:hypothetical protein